MAVLVSGAGSNPLLNTLMLTQVLGSLANPEEQPGVAPTFTPPQPEVGAGASTSATAQGGASGSMAGVAGTLLTAKDTFGYGRSMAA